MTNLLQNIALFTTLQRDSWDLKHFHSISVIDILCPSLRWLISGLSSMNFLFHYWVFQPRCDVSCGQEIYTVLQNFCFDNLCPLLLTVHACCGWLSCSSEVYFWDVGIAYVMFIGKHFVIIVIASTLLYSALSDLWPSMSDLKKNFCWAWPL